jgi:predicted Zn-dependent peptidase
MSLEHHVIHEVLPNGISLVVVPLANTGAATTMVMMGVGSRYESDEQQGLAHFTEHMVFKGGVRYPSSQAITQALDAVGGEFNAFTSHEYTGFYAKTAAEHVGLSLDVLSDMLLHAKFPEEELAKEKGVIVEEINMYEDMPMRKVDYTLMELLFGDTPIGRSILGTKKSVTSFTSEDFLNYRKQFYLGRQCTIVVTGSVKPDEVKKQVEHYFGAMPAGEAYKPVAAQFIHGGDRIKIEPKKSEQTHFMLAAEAYPTTDARRYALRILAVILGGNMSSRLFVKVREEQGLCYYVRANTDTYMDAGFLVASAGVDNSRLKHAVQAIVDQFKEIRDHGVTDEEMERAKSYLTGKTLLSMEDSEHVAEYYSAQDRMEGTRETPAEVLELLLKVTKADVTAVAQDIFQDQKLRLAVIGPDHESSHLEKILTLS